MNNGLNCLESVPKGNALYINPPYSNIISFVDWTLKNVNDGYIKKFCFLVPARTDTKWFFKLYDFGCVFAFIKGRLKFGNSNNSAPFPSVFIYFNSSNKEIIKNNMFIIDKENIQNLIESL